MTTAAVKKLLIIKHGALGDIILCSGALKSIRLHHPHDHIVLLTTKSYAGLLQQSGYFDEIWIDDKPKLWHVRRLWKLQRKLAHAGFTHVYDLQTSQRSSFYYRLFRAPKPLWSGIAKGAAFEHTSPARTSMHTIDRQTEQLHLAGITDIAAPDISWMGNSADAPATNQPYVLLVPGGSAHRPEKRYPQAHYITLAKLMLEQGLTPVLIGGGAENTLLDAIATAVPQCQNLCNNTTLNDIAALAREAVYAIGNDTGPMHIIAATGCPSVVMFSHASNPDLCAPRGDHVHIMRAGDLHTIAPESIMAIMADQIKTDTVHNLAPAIGQPV